MSDWKQSANKRRDARQTKSPDEEPKPGVAKAKKRTKDWCRGKQGVLHTPECMDYNLVKWAWPNSLFNGWRLLVCTKCGKELDLYTPNFHVKPDWVK